MQQTDQLLTREGTVFEEAIASFPLCCPSRATHLTGQYAHNHGVLHNGGPFGGYKRLAHANTLPVWLQRAGYRTMHVGRYLNGYEYADGIPPGWDDWHGVAALRGLQLRALAGQRERVARLAPRRRPSGRVPDRLPRPARERADRAGRPRRQALLPPALVRRAPPRRAARRRRPDHARHPLPRGAPPRPVRGQLDAALAELRRGEHAGQAPGGRRPTAAHAPAGRRDRGELAPGARGAAGRRRRGGADRRHPRAHRRAGQHADRLHLRQRLHARRAPRAGREGAALRGVDPGATDHARTRHPARWADPRPVANIDVVPTIVDAAGRHRGTYARRAFPARPGRGPRGLAGTRSADRERQRGEQRARLPGASHQRLPLRGAPHDGRVRALRPRARSLPAAQRGRVAGLRADPTRHGAAPAPAQELRRARMSEAPGAQARPALRRPARARRGLRARRPAGAVGGRDRGRVVGAVFTVGRRRVASVAAEGPISQRIRPPRVRRGRRYLLRVRAELRDGRLFTIDRRLRSCR